MMKDKNRQSGLRSEEQKRYAALRQARKPPRDLENKIVDALRSRGFIRPTKPILVWALPRIVGAAILLVMGFALGVWYNQPASRQAGQPVFAMFLYELPSAPAEESVLVEEYRNWARTQYQRGHLLSGEKLRNQGRVLRRSATGLQVREVRFSGKTEVLAGYFLIRASSYDEAEQIAATCPHLKYGGVIELRAIEKT